MSISVLVVDDNPEKLSDIRELVLSSGIGEGDIVQKTSADGVRQYLSQNSIDVFIVDIALPQYEDEAPVKDTGIALLRQIFRQKRFHKPKYVIGVTAHSDVKDELDTFFESNLWYLLFRPGGDDSWKARLKSFLEKVIDANRPVEAIEDRPDVFVIAAKREIELQALLNLPIEWSLNLPLDDSSFYRKGTFDVSGRSYQISIGSPHRIGLVPATTYAQKVLDCLKPRILVMNGICAGVEGECKIGDVLLAESSWEWQSGKYTNEKNAQFLAEPNFVSIDQQVASRFEVLTDDIEFIAKLRANWPANKPPNAISLRSGPIASGSSVLADQELVTKIKATHRKLLGIDMEIYGVYYVAFTTPQPKPVFFAIKSVSDFANSEKNDDYQSYCAYLSTNVLIEFLRRNMSDLIG